MPTTNIATYPFALRPLLIILLLAGLWTITGCDQDDNIPEKKPSVQTSTHATLGAHLTDSLGNSLYMFANDFDGKTNCTGGCLNLWPVYYAGDNLTQDRLADGLNIADFATITTAGGQKQTTYKTWPLYYYAPVVNGTNTRELPGETKGEGIGGVWNVAKPDYTIQLVNAQLTGLDGKNYTSAYVEGTGKTLYFSDSKGLTIYTFSKDSFNINKFTKPDFTNNNVWPIYETDKVVVPSTLDKTLFGSITVAGRKQLTYKGWPLYHFGSDNQVRGSNKGVSVPVPGTWPVAVKDKAEAPKP